MKFSVVIPVYNSEKTIESLVDKLVYFFDHHQYLYEIILVDDSSQDESWKQIQSISMRFEGVKGIRLEINQGQQMAIYKGLHLCSGDYVLTMDDDGQHDINDLLKIIPLIDHGYDLVFGVYRSYNDPSFRQRGSGIIGRFFKWRFKNLKGLRVSSYRVIEKSLYTRILNQELDFIYLSAELLGYAEKVGNVEITRHLRLEGQSGYTFMKLVKLGIKLYFYYGLPHIKDKLQLGRDSNETIVNGWRR